MNAPSAGISHIVRMLAFVTACIVGCSIEGCSSSQHATGDTKFTREGDRVLVEVVLDEYKIHMPTSIPAGNVVFQIRNAGTHDHNIRIAGHGVEAAPPHNLKPGESTELSVPLKPGKYKVDCPIGPHSALGMHLELTVT